MRAIIACILAALFVVIAAHLFVPNVDDADKTVQALAVQLQSDKPSEWRVAQVYLAHAGVEALPELERLADGAGDALQQRIKETASLMLRNAVGAESICEYPNLWILVEQELKKGACALRILAGSKQYDSGNPGLTIKTPPLTQPRKAMNDLIELRGFAVLAARELLADEQPGSRMYGTEILLKLNAIGQHQALLENRNDNGCIDVDCGCYTRPTTVGAETTAWLERGYLRPSVPDAKYAIREPENYADWLDIFSGGKANQFVLINHLRQVAGTNDAESWDDYWRRARPVLKKLWDSK